MKCLCDGLLSRLPADIQNLMCKGLCFLQVTLDRVCNYANTALFCLPCGVEGLALEPEKGNKSPFCRVFGLE